MFDNADKHLLWKLSPDSVKTADITTKQMVYEGVERGQSERYMIAVGMLLEDLFFKVRDSYDSRDMFKTPDAFLFYLQNEFRVRYLEVTGNEKLVRYMLENIFIGWMGKGSKRFLIWFTEVLFGWGLDVIRAFGDDVFITTSFGSRLYDPNIRVDNNKILFFLTAGGSLHGIEIEVDVRSDPDFLEKKEIFEGLLLEWTYVVDIEYINTP